MAIFKNILFPVDFSDRCRSAAPFVKMMAGQGGSELTVMHVIDLPVSVYSTIGYETMLDLRAMRRAAREQLDAFAATELAGVPLHLAVEEGRAAVRIAHFAQTRGTELIMMPTHGYGPFRRALLGSVAAKVLHDAVCPVWTSAHVEASAAPQRPQYRSVLCAVDLEAKNTPLIRDAAHLAEEFDAKLRLVHAIPQAETLPESHFDVEYRRFLFENARRELARMQTEACTDLEVCIEGGSVARVVRAAAEYHEADLVVIGRGVIQEPLGRLRTNTYAVIRESICPVLSW
jgi:nucleotide-binding universal stress UspA family protein